MNLLYIDDDDEDKVAPYYEPVQDDYFRIQYRQVDEWGVITDSIINLINENNISGLILDWQLNLNSFFNENGEKKKAKYKAAEVAQFIRRSISETEIKKDIPIFVWSMEDKLLNSYEFDNTSHDLFDKIFLKSGNDYSVLTNPVYVRTVMIAFVNAYNKVFEAINNEEINYSKFLSLLGLEEKSNSVIVETVFDYFLGIENVITTRSVVSFISKELVNKSGLLIDDALLAVRFGINISLSPDWPALLEKLTIHKYKGIFSDFLNRYWTKGFFKYWLSISPDYPEISLLNSTKRVEILKLATGLKDLTPITSEESNPGQYFWNICEVSRLPLDPDDSIMVREPDPLPWQERRYISVYVAKNDLGKRQGLVSHIVEKIRLD